MPVPAHAPVSTSVLRIARCCLLLALLLTRPASAHFTWLEPERFSATPGAILGFGLASGPEFNVGQHRSGGDGRPPVAGRLADQDVLIAPTLASHPGLLWFATLPRPGVAVFTAEPRPEFVEVAPAAVDRYLDTLYASDHVREQWSAFPAGASWREQRAVRLKAFVRVGEPLADDRGWQRAATTGLDVVTLRDPTNLRQDEELPVRVTLGGQPLPGALVAFISDGHSRERVVATDAAGEARARCDAAGAWLVRVVLIERATAASTSEWRTTVATCLLGVQR